MKKLKPTGTQKASAAHSFIDSHGATVTIPPGDAQSYAGVRSEQLRAVTQLLAVAVTGGIKLSETSIEVFQLMAHEYAIALDALIGIVADDADREAKARVATGGA